MPLYWENDENTAYWSQRWSLPITLDIQGQYDGSSHVLTGAAWLKHINKQNFPTYCFDGTSGNLLPSPANIIQCFKEDCYLEALVLVIAWGGMTRTKRKIYTQSNEMIEHALRSCVLMTQRHGTVQHAWNILVNRLQWGAVITSKVLHFLARSLDYEVNPPVPIDNKVVIDQIWPQFLSAIKTIRQKNDNPLPGSWYNNKEASWQTYNRYMTAIRYWAQAKGWTTTQFENTIFQEYYPSP